MNISCVNVKIQKIDNLLCFVSGNVIVESGSIVENLKFFDSNNNLLAHAGNDAVQQTAYVLSKGYFNYLARQTTGLLTFGL